MKGFFNSLALSFAIVGSIIGAGFITGAEIVTFFSSSKLLPSCVILFVLLSVFLVFLMLAGSRYGSQSTANLRVLGRFSYFFNACVYIFSFLATCGMCAGLDAVLNSAIGINERLPTLSIPCIVLSFFICKKGVEGLKVFNSLLVPFMLLVIVFACLVGGESVVENFPQKVQIFSVATYVGMNCFLSSAVIVDSGRGMRVWQIVVASVTASLIVAVCVYMIMRKISLCVSVDENLPLLSSLNKSKVFYVIFSVVTVFGIVTTLVSSHYPLVRLIGKSPMNLTLNACLMICAIALSRIGFYKIVSLCYPVIGVVGLLYALAFIWHGIKKLPSSNGKPFK